MNIILNSGTTGVACKNTNMNFIGIEMDKGYFNIVVERILNIKAYELKDTYTKYYDNNLNRQIN